MALNLNKNWFFALIFGFNFIAHFSMAAVVTNPPYQLRFDDADQVLIVSIVKVTPLALLAPPPAGVKYLVDSYTVDFKINAVLKGKSSEEGKESLVFYQLSRKNQMVINGPRFIDFDSRAGNNYLLFLKDGKLLYGDASPAASMVKMANSFFD